MSDVDVIELRVTQQYIDRRTREITEKQVPAGFLLHRSGQYAGVNLSWSPRQCYLAPFESREAAEAGAVVVQQMDAHQARVVVSGGSTIRRVSCVVPVDSAVPSNARESRLTVTLSAAETATLAAIASAMGCKPTEAVAGLLRLIRR